MNYYIQLVYAASTEIKQWSRARVYGSRTLSANGPYRSLVCNVAYGMTSLCLIGLQTIVKH